MAANKLINFRCPDDLLAAIELYGRQYYPTTPNGRGNTDFDQSKALRDILISGIETLTNGEVKIEREPVRQSNKSDNCIDLEAIAAQLSTQFEDRFRNLEEALAGK